MAEDVGNWRWEEGAPPSDADSVAIGRASVLAAHSLQTPRWRAPLSSRSTTSTAPRPTAGAADCRKEIVRRVCNEEGGFEAKRLAVHVSRPLLGVSGRLALEVARPSTTLLQIREPRHCAPSHLPAPLLHTQGNQSVASRSARHGAKPPPPVLIRSQS